MDDEAQIAYDAQEWKQAISQYADIQELDAATLNRLVKNTVVHVMICTGLHGADICDSLSGEPAINSCAYGWRERMPDRRLALITYVKGFMSTL